MCSLKQAILMKITFGQGLWTQVRGSVKLAKIHCNFTTISLTSPVKWISSSEHANVVKNHEYQNPNDKNAGITYHCHMHSHLIGLEKSHWHGKLVGWA